MFSYKEVVEIKANATASKLILANKKHPLHFNLLKSTISKIESMSGVIVKVPIEYKVKKD